MKTSRIYDAWLRYALGTETPERRFESEEAAFLERASPEEKVEAITLTFARCAKDLVGFDDSRLASGMQILFDQGEDDWIMALQDTSVPLDRRVDALRALPILYRHCFAPRLPDNAPHNDKLKHLVFMLWEFSPLVWWEEHVDWLRMYEELTILLAEVLEIDNRACRMSALHGLGHLVRPAGPGVSKCINRFLEAHPELDQEVREYARVAATGRLQ